MLNGLSLLLVLANGTSAHSSQAATAQPPAIVHTVRVDSSGTRNVETHAVDRDISTLTIIGPDGPIAEATSRSSEKRILIELRERPLLDAKNPGSRAEAARQREQLVRDLAAIDARLHSRVPARVTRHFETLFSGVAATVSSEALAEIRASPSSLPFMKTSRCVRICGERAADRRRLSAAPTE
jgi:hypothetical protein